MPTNAAPSAGNYSELHLFGTVALLFLRARGLVAAKSCALFVLADFSLKHPAARFSRRAGTADHLVTFHRTGPDSVCGGCFSRECSFSPFPRTHARVRRRA